VGSSSAGEHFRTEISDRSLGLGKLQYGGTPGCFRLYGNIGRQVALGTKVECGGGGVHGSAIFKRRFAEAPYILCGALLM
jgi:hypothetical protein